MTNLQALKITFPNLNEQDLKNNCLLWGLDPDGEYKANNSDYWWVVYNTIGQALYGGVTRISEGGYTIEYDKDALIKWYNSIANDWGFDTYDDFGGIVNMTSAW